MILEIKLQKQSPLSSSKMITMRIVLVAAAIMLFSQTTSALPTRRSASDTGSRGSDTDSSDGSSSGSGNTNCATPQLTSPSRTASSIVSELGELESTLVTTHVYQTERASVGVYGDDDVILEDASNCSASLPSEQGRAIASSVAFLQKFLRPVGDILTNETVREVIDLETGGFADKFSTILEKLTSITTEVYKLVKGDQDIHECILPGLPLTSSHTVLKPSAPPSVRSPSYRDMVVDGVAFELETLILHLRSCLECYFEL